MFTVQNLEKETKRDDSLELFRFFVLELFLFFFLKKNIVLIEAKE